MTPTNDEIPERAGEARSAEGQPLVESDRALLLLDCFADRFQGPSALPSAASIVRYVQGELRYFRERGRPVIFACTASVAPRPLLVEISARSDEAVLRKPSLSAFFGTDLMDHLTRLQVRRLTIVGLETNGAVLLTAGDAMARGFAVVVPEPCVAAASDEDHKFALRQIREAWPPLFQPSNSGDRGE